MSNPTIAKSDRPIVTPTPAPAPAPVATPARAKSGRPRRYNTIEMAAFQMEGLQEASGPIGAGPTFEAFDFADFDIDADGAFELDGLPSPQSKRGKSPRSSSFDPPDATMWDASDIPSCIPSCLPPAPSPSSPPSASSPPNAGASSASSTTSSGPDSMPRTISRQMLPPAPSVSSSTVRRPSATSYAAVDPHAALVAFAGFGDPPSSVWGAPAYALRVRARRRILLKDLAAARQRRSHDVGLYEASLRTADDVAVRNGFLFISAVAAFALMITAALVYVLGGAHLA